MTEQYYALYVDGKKAPIGVLRDSMLEAISEIARSNRKKI